MDTPTVVRPARFPDDLDVVRSLFVEYAAGLGVDLGYQGFDGEVASLPGKYAPPAGRLLLAWRGDRAAGCVALRPLEGTTCEMKRLYVRPEARGDGAGRRLVHAILDAARDAGYARICLDTLPTLGAAWALYASLGFDAVEPYVFNPISGARFLARAL